MLVLVPNSCTLLLVSGILWPFLQLNAIPNGAGLLEYSAGENRGKGQGKRGAEMKKLKYLLNDLWCGCSIGWHQHHNSGLLACSHLRCSYRSSVKREVDFFMNPQILSSL